MPKMAQRRKQNLHFLGPILNQICVFTIAFLLFFTAKNFYISMNLLINCGASSVIKKEKLFVLSDCHFLSCHVHCQHKQHQRVSLKGSRRLRNRQPLKPSRTCVERDFVKVIIASPPFKDSHCEIVFTPRLPAAKQKHCEKPCDTPRAYHRALL